MKKVNKKFKKVSESEEIWYNKLLNKYNINISKLSSKNLFFQIKNIKIIQKIFISLYTLKYGDIDENSYYYYNFDKYFIKICKNKRIFNLILYYNTKKFIELYYDDLLENYNIQQYISDKDLIFILKSITNKEIFIELQLTKKIKNLIEENNIFDFNLFNKNQLFNIKFLLSKLNGSSDDYHLLFKIVKDKKTLEYMINNEKYIAYYIDLLFENKDFANYFKKV